MIRQGQLSDISAIHKINREQLHYDYPLDKTTDNFKKILADSKHHFLLVFEDDATKQVLGYVHAELYLETYEDVMFNILALAVDRAAQKMGIGSQLMTKIEELAKTQGISQIRLNSGEERLGAHRFYEKIGYVSNKKQKRFYKKLI